MGTEWDEDGKDEGVWGSEVTDLRHCGRRGILQREDSLHMCSVCVCVSVCARAHTHRLEERFQRPSTCVYQHLGSGFEFKEVPSMPITDLQHTLRLDCIHVALCRVSFFLLETWDLDTRQTGVPCKPWA